MGVIIVSRSAPETVPEQNAKVTFQAHIPVAEGDQIALDYLHTGDQVIEDCFYWTGGSNDFVYTVGDRPADGEVSPWTAGYGYGSRRVNIQATLETPGGDSPVAQDPQPQTPTPHQPKSMQQSPSKSRHCTKRKARKGHRHRHCGRRRG